MGDMGLENLNKTLRKDGGALERITDDLSLAETWEVEQSQRLKNK